MIEKVEISRKEIHCICFVSHIRYARYEKKGQGTRHKKESKGVKGK